MRRHCAVTGLWLLAAGCGAGSKDSAPETTTIVGPAGGAVRSAGVQMDIPRGALATDTAISVALTQTPGPSGSGAITDIYQFEPAGLAFSAPVTVAFDIPPGVSKATIYWSHKDGVGYDPLPTYVTGQSTLVATVTHFSSAFLGTPVGQPAYTTTSAAFVQPTAGATVSVSVGNSDWMAPGQFVFIATGGTYAVASITDVNTVVLTNLGYSANAFAGATIASGKPVVAGGAQGPTGAGAGAGAGLGLTKVIDGGTGSIGLPTGVVYLIQAFVSYQAISFGGMSVIGESNSCCTVSYSIGQAESTPPKQATSRLCPVTRTTDESADYQSSWAVVEGDVAVACPDVASTVWAETPSGGQKVPGPTQVVSSIRLIAIPLQQAP